MIKYKPLIDLFLKLASNVYLLFAASLLEHDLICGPILKYSPYCCGNFCKKGSDM